jgi:hypothetical protein
MATITVPASAGQRASPRRARVRRIGIVTITTAHCECGRPVEPNDFEAVSSVVLRAICARCHRDVLEITRPADIISEEQNGAK